MVDEGGRKGGREEGHVYCFDHVDSVLLQKIETSLISCHTESSWQGIEGRREGGREGGSGKGGE